MFNRNFPYSDYEVVVVEKQDILKTIDENILDKDVALELITSLEVKAESFIEQKRWTGIPYLGNIRIPKGNSKEVQDTYKDIRHFAYKTMDKKSYIAFIHEIAMDNHKAIKYNKYFNQILAISIRKDRAKWTRLCRAKGENYASCKMVFGYLLSPMKEDYEYIIENKENVENGDETGN